MKSRLAHVLADAYGVTAPRPPVLLRAEPGVVEVGDWQSVRIFGQFLHPSDSLLVTRPLDGAGEPLAELRNLAWVDPATLPDGESAFDLEIQISSDVGDGALVYLATERPSAGDSPLITAEVPLLEPIITQLRPASVGFISGGFDVGQLWRKVGFHEIEVFIENLNLEDWLNPSNFRDRATWAPIVNGQVGNTSAIFNVDGFERVTAYCQDPAVIYIDLAVGATEWQSAPVDGTSIGLVFTLRNGKTLQTSVSQEFIVSGQIDPNQADPAELESYPGTYAPTVCNG